MISSCHSTSIDKASPKVQVLLEDLWECLELVLALTPVQKLKFSTLKMLIAYWFPSLVPSFKRITNNDLEIILQIAQNRKILKRDLQDNIICTSEQCLLGTILHENQYDPELMKQCRDYLNFLNTECPPIPNPDQKKNFLCGLLLYDDFRFIPHSPLQFQYNGTTNFIKDDLPLNIILDLPHLKDWLSSLSDDKLSNLLQHLLPFFNLYLLNTTPLVQAGFSRMDSLTISAQCAVLDSLLLQRDCDSAVQWLRSQSGEASAPPSYFQARLASLDFVQGNYEAALQGMFRSIDQYRKESLDNREYLRGLPELVYLLSGMYCSRLPAPPEFPNPLLYPASPADFWSSVTGIAYEYPINDSQQRPHMLFQRLHAVISSLRFEYFAMTLPAFLEVILLLWLHLEDWSTNETQDYLDDLIPLLKKNKQALLYNLARQLQNTLSPEKDYPQDFFIHSPVEAIWLEYFNNFQLPSSNLPAAQATSDSEQRLIWVLDSPESLYLRPLIQKKRVNGGWSQGRFLTDSQASHMTSFLRDSKIPITRADRELAHVITSTYYSYLELKGRYLLKIAKSLLEMRNIYWDDDRQTPCHPILEKKPAVEIKKKSQTYCTLHFTPEVPDNFSEYALYVDENNDLVLVNFTENSQAIFQHFPHELTLPVAALPVILPRLQEFSQDLEIRSELALPLPEEDATVFTPKFILYVKQNSDTYDVRLMIKPFTSSSSEFIPLQGTMENLSQAANKQIVHALRNTQAEASLLENFFSTFPQLDNSQGRKTCSWSLSLQEVYEITTDFPKLGDFFELAWQGQNQMKKINQVDYSKLHLKTSDGEGWLDIEGKVEVNFQTYISFRQLLSLTAAQQGRFIIMDDGSLLQLSQKLRKQLDLLNNIGSTQGDGVRLNQYLCNAVEDELDELLTPELIPENWQTLARKIHAASLLQPELPADLSPDLVLRDYQQEGFRWMSRLAAWNAGACLADDMGLGKTLQAIAFLTAHQDEGPALVVAPTSVCPNWVDEMHKYAPTLIPVQFENTDRAELLQSLGNRQVLITSYGLFQRERENIEKILWRTAVLDEAQAIKNSHTKRSRAARRLQAEFRLVTTGTPIENNLGELWSIFQFLLPGLLGSEEHFRSRFAIPIEILKDSVAAGHLNSLVRPFILRRKKTEVLKQLPPKTEINITVEQSPEEKAFYEALRQDLLEKINGIEDSNQLRFNILAAITKLRQAACNPRLVTEKSLNIASSKMDSLEELLTDLLANQHHVLIFSQFVKHLELVRERLNDMNCSHCWLTGETTPKDRQKAIRTFQKGETDIFLISLKAGGVGLNLTQADFVILLDPWWNPAVEDQAADRAHRFGQTRPVTIYRLITKNTIEEKIIRLHAEKKNLAEQILQDTGSATTLSSEDLLKLLMEK